MYETALEIPAGKGEMGLNDIFVLPIFQKSLNKIFGFLKIGLCRFLFYSFVTTHFSFADEVNFF